MPNFKYLCNSILNNFKSPVQCTHTIFSMFEAFYMQYAYFALLKINENLLFSIIYIVMPMKKLSKAMKSFLIEFLWPVFHGLFMGCFGDKSLLVHGQ